VYNITGDGVLSGAQLLRELGLAPIPVPAIMDASKARQELGWRPRYSSLEALRDTLQSRVRSSPDG
jgi:nucleoside-diphosphate-sugar epimerase